MGFGEGLRMTRWPRLFVSALWADEPTAQEAALIAAFAIVVPFGWLVLLGRRSAACSAPADLPPSVSRHCIESVTLTVREDRR